MMKHSLSIGYKVLQLTDSFCFSQKFWLAAVISCIIFKIKKMEIETRIKISKEELTNLIKEHYKIDGDVNFIIDEETYKTGMTDGCQHYSRRYVFDGVEIMNSKQK